MSEVRPLTAYDLELFYRGLSGHPFIAFGDLLDIMKGTGEWATAEGLPAWNQIYGAFVWAQINQESVAFGMLPKTTWVRSGWRVKKGLSTTHDTIAIPELGTLPDSVKLEIDIVRARPKIQTIVFNVSDVVEALATISIDDVFGSMNQVRAEFGIEFAKLINRQLLEKNTKSEGAGNQFESIDRIVGSYDEKVNCPETGTVNIYNLNRDAGESWADAVVLHNEGTNRELTDELIRLLLVKAREKGANTNVLLTGYDTYAKIQGIYMTFVRYVDIGTTKVQLGVNGVQTVSGGEVGIQVATLYGLPLLQSVDTPSDGIQRLYALDLTDWEGYGLPRGGMSILRPVEYFETREYLLLNKYVIKGAYRIVGETVFRGIAFQGKVRDII